MNSFHNQAAASLAKKTTFQWRHQDTQFTYTFKNFFHPFVGELIAQLNRESLSGMLNAKWQEGLKKDFFKDLYKPTNGDLVQVEDPQKEIDLSTNGPYANYNWELFFHIPLMIAVHLSKNQRFAEAQRWFHYIFNPTSNDHTVEAPKRFWNFLAFRQAGEAESSMRIKDIVQFLSDPKNKDKANEIVSGYDAILNKPFQPHVVARTRHLAYQYNVVMKYLDNLIAWGDSLFQQDTTESINEATQIYVLSANILGERPQQIPPLGKVKAKTFAQLKNGLGKIGDALVELEGVFPLNYSNPSLAEGKGESDSSALFGIGRTLYFCIPKNDKLLGYWDTVADRLFKIRHCMNIAGVVRPLALFDPPIDPGMLVKAAAAGINIGSIVNGLNQPIGPVRSLFLIQKALELCGEVRGLGNALLSALEKGDAEHLALVRQRHEIQIQQMAQEVRFLQWKQAQENTTSLLTNRKTALERLKYYKRLLGLPDDPNAPNDLMLDRRELTEENFDSTYSALVGQYEKPLTLSSYSRLNLAQSSSPLNLIGADGNGNLYLNTNEDADLNIHSPTGHTLRLLSMAIETLHAPLAFVPELHVNTQFWGLGATINVFGGSMLVNFGRQLSSLANIGATLEEAKATAAVKTASYQRRGDEWLFQYNLAAHELMQIGRQILTSLIAEQIAHHEYQSIKQQIVNAQEVNQFLHDKFTNEDLYLWMQGEISRLYYEYYRFAFDTARKAEKTMKQELMRPELDTQDFVKFNYWDAGRKGLLSGEALYLDVKRMEMAYHDNNKRELELTKHVSLRQLDPVALLTLKTTGTCQITIPEWLFDLDGPGHYMRRIKNVALSIPCVAGPYTSVNCTLSLLKSSVRKSPIAGDDYTRQGTEDERFVDYIGAVQSIVTSTGQNDSGMFETNLRDERFLPFEGAGVISTWRVDLPKEYRSFDYDTISDVILHIRYTARQGVEPNKVKNALDGLFGQANQAGLALLFSLRHDFPTEWAKFMNGKSNEDFTATIRRDYFPYVTQSRKININGFDLYKRQGKNVINIGNQTAWNAATSDLENKQEFTIAIQPKDADGKSLDTDAFLIVRYSLEK